MEIAGFERRGCQHTVATYFHKTGMCVQGARQWTKSFSLGWSFTKRHSKPNVQLFPKILSHSLLPSTPALLPSRSLTLGLSKLSQWGKRTARHKIWHEASRGSGAGSRGHLFQKQSPVWECLSTKSQPHPTVPLLILRHLSLLHSYLNYSQLTLC